MDYSIKWLEDNNLIIFKAIVGSQAYGTSTATSDVDIKGVFVLPLDKVLGFGYVEQVSDEKNDTVYYEIRRFLQLLQTNNPTILELLNIPSDCVLHKDPLFDMVLEKKDLFITKVCKFSFGGFAVEQIKKAHGLNKKIVKPMDEKRKSVLDFCFVPDKQGSVPVEDYLARIHVDQRDIGLVGIAHMRYVYGAYIAKYTGLCDSDGNFIRTANTMYYKGIVQDAQKSNDISLSEVPKDVNPDFLLQFNKDGYSSYCKEYKEYWDWVKKRNPQRYLDNMLHEGGYDGKNLAHCHRLLDMAIEIGEGKGINVKRDNREYLLSVRRGEHDYDTLLREADAKIAKMNEVFETSSLPDSVDYAIANQLLLDIRKARYFL